MLSVNDVVYVEIVKGLSANNRYGSDGAAGVIIVKTSVSASKNELINFLKTMTQVLSTNTLIILLKIIITRKDLKIIIIN